MIGGPVADTFGVRSLYFIASGAWLVIASLALFIKPLMELEERPGAAASPTGTSP